ncbi:tRNA (adenosine(37)-N6)-threonylcarbamoyltransferase complex ATPase subunit type 1 TsaE [Clostridiaceae bacterium HSG29]|nr:tRNA (adenosine(37)-N6)-threonylcarbamoyltransferase complex ATPase subunit type 1 TsaE [Clostridiaceae bacterium HSG29]
MKVVCKNENDTKRLAKEISNIVKAGDVICLDGDLGAGKTTFTKYLCEDLGVKGYVNSPSYSIVNEYDGDVKINHFDVYRIFSVDELYEIGYEEYFNNTSICIVEWAKKIEELIPDNSIWMNITLGNSFDERIIDIKGLDDKLSFEGALK